MDTARDLACAELWQASLERSLARRGRPTRSSLELFHLRPERDLSCVDILRESAAFSQLRRSAASRRPSMALPGAGGISALALLAAATLPGLLGGRAGSVRTARITYRAGEHDAHLAKATVAAATASAAVKAATPPGDDHARPIRAPRPCRRTPLPGPPHRRTGRPRCTLMPPRPSPARTSPPPRTATASAAASHGVSGGAAPEAQHSVSAAATAPASPQGDRDPQARGPHAAAAVHNGAGHHHTAPDPRSSRAGEDARST